MQIRKSSIRFKLMTLVIGIGILIFIFFMVILPPKVRQLSAEVMTDNASFIVQLLADNLAIDMQVMLLDEGKSVEQTIELLKIGSKKNLIESVSVFDSDLKFVRGNSKRREDIRTYGKPKAPVVKESDTHLTLFSPIKDANQNNLGFVEIIFSKEFVLAKTQNFLKMIYMAGFCVIAIGLLMAFLIARGIIIVLKSVSCQMNESAQQVALVSDQVFSASQSLAQRTSEQVASIEETSESLEEMSSMIRQNANNASQANALMQETSQVVEAANTSMAELNKSIDETSRSSEEIFRIIKTIDEIAFQTNLLALNAAVEAARAGEAGSGFAVVAEEVRNLAIRSAEAARNTSELIENTVKRVKDETEIVSRTDDIFTKVVTITRKVRDLIEEITAASQEQSKGTDQVNQAVIETDRITQQNTASAEKSASVSEKLKKEAAQMKILVRELTNLIGNGEDVRDDGSTESQATRDRWDISYDMPGSQSFGRKEKPVVPSLKKDRDSSLAGTKEVSPEQLIPFDDDDFEDF